IAKEAYRQQGAPSLAAVRADAHGTQTIPQARFAAAEPHTNPTLPPASLSYGAFGLRLGRIPRIARTGGMERLPRHVNELMPQMVSTYLRPSFIGLFLLLVIGSLSSTADSDLSALSAIMMADVYGKNIAKNRADPRKMLIIGRTTMIVATVLGMILASMSF